MGTVTDGKESGGHAKGQAVSNEFLKTWPLKLFSKDKKSHC